MGGVVLMVSGSMTKWGCRVRGSDLGRLRLMSLPPKTIVVLKRWWLHRRKTLTVPENTYSDDISN